MAELKLFDYNSNLTAVQENKIHLSKTLFENLSNKIGVTNSAISGEDVDIAELDSDIRGAFNDVYYALIEERAYISKTAQEHLEKASFMIINNLYADIPDKWSLADIRKELFFAEKFINKYISRGM